MGALIRAFDWLSTTLGSPRDWPAALRTTLRLLLTTQHPVFVFWGPEHICFYNDAYRQYLGPEQHPSILGMRGRDAWPETWDLIAPQIDLVMRGGEATWHENQLVPITRNGRREEAYWTYSYGPIDDESAPNGVGGVIVLCTETTDKVLAEQRLTGEIARERRLFEQAPSFICILEQPDHRFVFVNHALIQVFGDRNFIDRPVREVFPELEGQGFFDLLDRVYSTGKRFIARGMPASIQRTPGAPRENLLLDFIYEPVRDENGVVTGILCDGYEVTERVRAENKLRESEARYRVLIDSAKEYAIVTMDNEGLITSWSSGAERMMGYTAPEIIGQSSAVLFTHEDVMTNAPKDELTRAREEGQAENERWHRRKDGSLFWSSGRVMPLMNEGMNGFVKIFQDRTAQRDAEAARDAALARLQDADRQKDEFLATLGHELRNPLTPIRYAARLLKHGCTPEMVEQARVTIDRQTTQMARLLDDLLDISRITRNVIELRRDTMDLRDAIKLGVEIAWPIVNSVGHELKVHLPPEAVYVVGDPARLAQIVSNLLHNAAKFTEPGGRIVVSLQREADEAVIRVSDNGIGLTRESMERVFGLFTQVGGPHGQSRGGLGIGLAVVKRLVELHGGRVDVASAGLGTGSEFTVRLPLAAVGTSPKHHGLTNEAPLDRPHAQVLVVDDNVDAADSLAAILRSDGYSVKVAYDGVSAMELAEILQPQLVVLDLGLPRADGYAVARWIRQQPWGSGAHIVAVTGWGQKNDRERSSAAGFDAHLVKPVDPNDLERWLEKSAHAVARSNS